MNAITESTNSAENYSSENKSRPSQTL